MPSDGDTSSPQGTLPDGWLVPGLRRRTAREFVYETLRRAILRGSIAVETRIVQADVAKQLQVSTTPVREALRDLAAEDLVRIDPHRGAIVRGLDLEEVAEIYELRMLLEPVSIRKAAARITDEQVERAERLYVQMAEEVDPGTWGELNRDFHAIFAEAADSSYLSKILGMLRDSATSYVRISIELRPEQAHQANREHRELLDACQDKNADAAAEVVARHLEGTWKTIVRGQQGAQDS